MIQILSLLEGCIHSLISLKIIVYFYPANSFFLRQLYCFPITTDTITIFKILAFMLAISPQSIDMVWRIEQMIKSIMFLVAYN